MGGILKMKGGKLHHAVLSPKNRIQQTKTFNGQEGCVNCSCPFTRLRINCISFWFFFGGSRYYGYFCTINNGVNICDNPLEG